MPLAVYTSRHVLAYNENNSAVQDLESELKNICGAASTLGFPHAGRTYYNVVAEIEGSGPQYEIVLIGAHLDSTAACEPGGYDPGNDPAPGADDNWSGVTAVLEVARALRLRANASPPQRSIRFVLFNAEEDGIVGSRLYADHLKQHEGQPGEPSVVAMIAMDMIGWHHPDVKAPFPFEIHGVGDAYIENTTGREYLEATRAKDATDQLVNVIREAAAHVAPNLTAEIYPREVDGRQKDPMVTRSDHWWFQHHLWPACLVTEDMWPPPKDQKGNPHYHTRGDVSGRLDPDYQAAIARTVAAAAWVIATRPSN